MTRATGDVPGSKVCAVKDCTQLGGWVLKRPPATDEEPKPAKRWMAATSGDRNRKCWWHGPAAYTADPGRRSGDPIVVRWDDGARLAGVARQLKSMFDVMRLARANIDEALAGELVGSGGAGAGVSDPTGGAALRIGSIANYHRDLTAALDQLERSAARLVMEADRCCGELVAKAEAEEQPKVKPYTCPAMVLRVETDHPTKGSVQVRCGKNTAHKIGDQGEPVVWDPDGYCLDHRAEAEARLRDADAELAEAIVGRRPLTADRRRRLPSIHQMLDDSQYPARSESGGVSTGTPTGSGPGG